MQARTKSSKNERVQKKQYARQSSFSAKILLLARYCRLLSTLKIMEKRRVGKI